MRGAKPTNSRLYCLKLPILEIVVNHHIIAVSSWWRKAGCSSLTLLPLPAFLYHIFYRLLFDHGNQFSKI